jgi:nitric oxide reductase NorQ protein
MSEINNTATFHADLPDALRGVFGQVVNETYADKLNRFYHEDSGRAVIRVRGGSTEKKVRGVVSAEPMTGENIYVRPNGETYSSRTWGDHADIEVLRKGRILKQYSLLYGPPGTGKTALLEAAFGDELLTIIGTGDTEVADFVGGYIQTPSGGFEWVDGPLVQAIEEGKVLLIDEIGLIDPKVLSVVYGLMDGRGELRITQNPERGVVKVQDGFYVVAATNPNAPGVRLSEALLSRFGIQAEMGTDWTIAKKLGVPMPVITASQNLAKRYVSGEVSWSPQMREVLTFKLLAENYGTSWAISNLIASAPELDRPVVAEIFSKIFGEVVQPARI